MLIEMCEFDLLARRASLTSSLPFRLKLQYLQTAIYFRRLWKLLATPMRLSKPSQSRTPESDRESHGTTKPVGVTLKTKILKPISLGSR